MALLFASCDHLSFLLFCFEFCFFSFLSKNDPKKTGHSKNPKKQKCRKKRAKKNQLEQLCSQIVFFNFLAWASKFHFLAENTIKIVVSASSQTGKNTPKLAKMLSQNLVQVCCATRLDQALTQKNVFFFVVFCFARFSLKSHSHCRRRFLKNEKMRKIGPSFDSKNGYFWTKFWLYSYF